MKKRYEIFLSCGKAFEFDSAYEDVESFMVELKSALNVGALFVRLTADITIKIDAIEMIRRIEDE